MKLNGRLTASSMQTEPDKHLNPVHDRRIKLLMNIILVLSSVEGKHAE